MQSTQRGFGGFRGRGGWRNARPGNEDQFSQGSSSRSRGQWRGRGRGSNQDQGAQYARPTHFLALPLNNYKNLRDKVSAFQDALLRNDPPISGLDRTIVIDPRRLHLTLGVMALSGSNSGEEPPKTVESALDLLRSLKPEIDRLTEGKNHIQVPLDEMNVFSVNKENDARVLFVAPEHGKVDAESRRLKQVCDLVHQTFKRAGYITDTRPLKLHCTILNTSHRKPQRREPFSYSEILASPGCRLVAPDWDGSCSTGVVKVDLGTYNVGRVELWVMGSSGPNNEYISCGGIEIGN